MGIFDEREKGEDQTVNIYVTNIVQNIYRTDQTKYVMV